jgi:hypothetical protein
MYCFAPGALSGTTLHREHPRNRIAELIAKKRRRYVRQARLRGCRRRAAQLKAAECRLNRASHRLLLSDPDSRFGRLLI